MGICCVYDGEFFDGLEGLECVNRQPEGEDVEVNVGECVSDVAFSPFSQNYVPVVSFEDVKGWIASHRKKSSQGLILGISEGIHPDG
jgi:hypothetical protein